MLKSIFLLFICIIGTPIYAVCVVILFVVGAIFGLSYVDSSVYVCEYVQPIFTAVVALFFLIMALRKFPIVCRHKAWYKLALLFVFCVIYIVISAYCVKEFIQRFSTYSGMNNRQIFNFVVQKLNDMGDSYPKGIIHLPHGDSITYGYIMANIEVYILPISIVLLCGLIQWYILKSYRQAKTLR